MRVDEVKAWPWIILGLLAGAGESPTQCGGRRSRLWGFTPNHVALYSHLMIPQPDSRTDHCSRHARDMKNFLVGSRYTRLKSQCWRFLKLICKGNFVLEDGVFNTYSESCIPGFIFPHASFCIGFNFCLTFFPQCFFIQAFFFVVVSYNPFLINF